MKVTMRIALIRGPYLRPNGVYAWEALDRTTEHEVVAFESDPSRFDTDELNIPVKQLRWLDGTTDIAGYDRFFKRALSRFGFPSDYLQGVRGLVEDFDIIHTSENFNAFSLQAAVATKNTDTGFSFSTGENIPYPLNQRSPLMWKMKSFVNAQADAITTTTQLGKRALIHEGVPHSKITVVPNCIKPELFSPMADVDLEDVGLPKKYADETNILFVHGLTEQKGVPYLLEAFQQLEHENVNLVLVGDNQLSAEQTATITNADQITWLKQVPYEDMPPLYNSCDIFVLPSVTMTNNEEQFGMAVVEAMACELPTIVTNVGGLPFVVDRNRSSTVVSERSSEELREALSSLVVNKDLRESMGAAGREHVLSAYHPESVSDILREFYESSYK